MAKSFRDSRARSDDDEWYENDHKMRRELQRQDKRKGKITEANKVFEEKSDDE